MTPYVSRFVGQYGRKLELVKQLKHPLRNDDYGR